jgi:hypothetical protein
LAAIHDELRAEGVLKEGRALIPRGKLATYGRLYLTSQRLVFLQSSRAFMAFGALGAAAGQLGADGAGIPHRPGDMSARSVLRRYFVGHVRADVAVRGV